MAAFTHERLDLDRTKRIDIFRIIDAEQVLLMFQPLKSLYGFYQPSFKGAPSGILINSSHPTPLQRFTAAHELGHHLLGHQAAIDDQQKILARGNRNLDSIEVEAQAFAANFLMPPELVHTTRVYLGLPRMRAEPTPIQVYRMSLEMGSSYEATVQQLFALEIITRRIKSELDRIAPLEIKKRLLLGERPTHARNDVWIMGQNDSGHLIQPRVNDELILELPESPSTGYVWEPENQLSPFRGILGVINDEYVTTQDERVGGTLERRMHLTVQEEGAADFGIYKRRPWEPEQAVDRFNLTVRVVQSATGETGQGLFLPQQERLASL